MKKLDGFLLAIGILVSGAFGQTNASISGTVLDDYYPARRMNAPIAGVRAELWTPVFEMVSGPEPTLPPIQIVTTWWLADTAETDKYGLFSLTAPFTGKYIITFAHPDFNSREFDMAIPTAGMDTAMQVLMVPASAKVQITGTVWQSCTGVLGMPCVLQPMPGCSVSIQKSRFDGHVMPPYASLFYQSVITDAQGQYVIDSVPLSYNGERLAVTASRFGYVPQTRISDSVRRLETPIVDFTLKKAATNPGDTVFVTPTKPTAADSLVFQLVLNAHCCATKFRDKTVTISGQNIILSFSFDDTLCSHVNCPTGFSQTEFSSKPIDAGQYDIFMLQHYYCGPGRPCASIVYVPVLVGSVTVTPAISGVSSARGTIYGSFPDLSFTGTAARVLVAKASRITLHAYNMRGALLGEVFNGPVSAGVHHFSLNKAFGKPTCGSAIILRLSVDGSATISRRVVVLQ